MRKGVVGVIGLLIFVFLLGFISGACPPGEGYLGNKEFGSCVRISQTCSTCTYVNISSITLSTSNDTLTSNVEMIDSENGEWTYQFCNTSAYGNYFVTGVGDVSGQNQSFKSCFDVGQNVTIGESIVYFIFIFILFLLLLVLFYFILILPKENRKNQNNEFIEIIRLRYLRPPLIVLSYALTIIILNLMNGLAIQFATSSIFAGTIGFLFETMMRVAWIFTVIIVLWIFYMLMQDSNVKKNMQRLGRFNLRSME